jgi:hypothetical protein
LSEMISGRSKTILKFNRGATAQIAFDALVEPGGN